MVGRFTWSTDNNVHILTAVGRSTWSTDEKVHILAAMGRFTRSTDDDVHQNVNVVVCTRSKSTHRCKNVKIDLLQDKTLMSLLAVGMLAVRRTADFLVLIRTHSVEISLCLTYVLC